jgi:hypothetical protein
VLDLGPYVSFGQSRAAAASELGHSAAQKEHLMKRLLVVAWAVSLLLGAGLAAPAQGPALTPNLSKVADGQGWKVAGRKASAFAADSKKGVRFDQRPGQGIAWLDDIEFAEGTIEVDIKGEDKPQQSFVGVAFRVVDEKTHDAVYFRPFNFKTTDAARRVRAVQYVSHPQFPWHTLRQDKPGLYEKAVKPVPDPDGWFHARIIVEKRKVRVFVDDGKEPCLVVEELSDRKGGKVGLWWVRGRGASSPTSRSPRPSDWRPSRAEPGIAAGGLFSPFELAGLLGRPPLNTYVQRAER